MARRPITPFAALPVAPPSDPPTDTPAEATTQTTLLPHGIAPDNLAALPRSCGVYVFRGEGALPLYIGKSVDLRARVLSHLRNADEAAMLAQSRRVDIYRTAGEIGALLLEAQWVKQHMPLYNIRLRRSRSLVAWRLSPDGANAGQPPQLVDSARHDFAHTSDLYGLYASRRAAHPGAHGVQHLEWPFAQPRRADPKHGGIRRRGRNQNHGRPVRLRPFPLAHLFRSRPAHLVHRTGHAAGALRRRQRRPPGNLLRAFGVQRDPRRWFLEHGFLHVIAPLSVIHARIPDKAR